MIYNVLFISEQKLKDFNPLNQNCDNAELRWGISQAQTIFIQETLGTNLFEEMGRLVETGDIENAGKIHYKEFEYDITSLLPKSASWSLAESEMLVRKQIIELL